ncbi:hypothetical protein VTL71DRAFT_4326 [Oculimacula yallundae]|uniref:Uncharacterized protein n=1 Tax=Oculimacula yallundae TaxID=86028 RepID=A0ABR4C685_9HELO
MVTSSEAAFRVLRYYYSPALPTDTPDEVVY